MIIRTIVWVWISMLILTGGGQAAPAAAPAEPNAAAGPAEAAWPPPVRISMLIHTQTIVLMIILIAS